MGSPATWLPLPRSQLSAPCSRWQERLAGPMWRQVYICNVTTPRCSRFAGPEAGEDGRPAALGDSAGGMGLGDLSSLRAESHALMHLQCLSPQSTGAWESSLGQGSMACDRSPVTKCPERPLASVLQEGRGVSKVCWGPLENLTSSLQPPF